MLSLEEMQAALRADKDLAVPSDDASTAARKAVLVPWIEGAMRDARDWAKAAFKMAWGLDVSMHRALPVVDGARFSDASWYKGFV